MNETKDFNNNTAPKANTGKRPGAAGVAAAGLGAVAGAGATGVSMAFENGLEAPAGQVPPRRPAAVQRAGRQPHEGRLSR